MASPFRSPVRRCAGDLARGIEKRTAHPRRTKRLCTERSCLSPQSTALRSGCSNPLVPAPDLSPACSNPGCGAPAALCFSFRGIEWFRFRTMKSSRYGRPCHNVITPVPHIACAHAHGDARWSAVDARGVGTTRSLQLGASHQPIPLRSGSFRGAHCANVRGAHAPVCCHRATNLEGFLSGSFRRFTNTCTCGPDAAPG